MGKLISVALLISFLPAFVFAFECTAERRRMKNAGVQVDRSLLVEEFVIGEMEKLSVDIKEAHFSVSKEDANIMAMITIGPTYELGNLFKGSLNGRGEMKLSFVTPKTTYILTCQE